MCVVTYIRRRRCLSMCVYINVFVSVFVCVCVATTPPKNNEQCYYPTTIVRLDD